MAHRTSLLLGIVVLLVMSVLAVVAGAGPARQGAATEPELLAALQAEGRASFFVTMTTRADLSAAFGMDWDGRGRYVWQALNEVARATQAPVLDYARRHGLDAHPFFIDNVVYIHDGTLQAARDLARLPGVARLRLERTLSLPEAGTARGAQPPTLSPEAELAWGLADVHAPELWELGVRGAGAKVASIDTGVQWDHPALIGQYGCPDDPGNPACWSDPSNICGGLPCDNNGHGTFDMGQMAADDDPDLAYTVGIAPDVTWIACKGCESNSCSEFALVSCAEWTLAPGGDPANRPHVVDNPWKGGGCDDWFMPEVTAWLAAGVVPAFPVGSGGSGCATAVSPGDYLEVVAAGAYDIQRNIASFNSRGPSCFGDMAKPNLVAPGVNICSTYPDNGWNCSYSGTSMATSYTAGGVALIVSGCPDLAGDFYLLLQTLQDSADEPPDGNCGAAPSGGNYTYGYGYMNVLSAVEACLPEGSPAHINKDKLNWAAASRPGYYKVVFAARIWDNLGSAAAGTTVYGTWTYPDLSTHYKTYITTALGQAKFPVKEPQTGVYTFCVTDISGNGYVYDPGANTAPDCLSATVGP